MKFPMIALAAVLSAAAVAPAQAQQPEQRPPEARAERMDPAKRIDRRVQMLTERLSLSADQAAKVKAILTQQSEQSRVLFEKRRAEGAARPTEEQRKAFREQMQQARERNDAEIVKVLNADQLKKFEELQKQRREPRSERGPRTHEGTGRRS